MRPEPPICGACGSTHPKLIAHITGHEPGKRLPTWRMAMLHHLLYGLSVITRVRVSLGLVVVARASETTMPLRANEKGAVAAP